METIFWYFYKFHLTVFFWQEVFLIFFNCLNSWDQTKCVHHNQSIVITNIIRRLVCYCRVHCWGMGIPKRLTQQLSVGCTPGRRGSQKYQKKVWKGGVNPLPHLFINKQAYNLHSCPPSNSWNPKIITPQINQKSSKGDKPRSLGAIAYFEADRKVTDTRFRVCGSPLLAYSLRFPCLMWLPGVVEISGGKKFVWKKFVYGITRIFKFLRDFHEIFLLFYNGFQKGGERTKFSPKFFSVFFSLRIHTIFFLHEFFPN